MECPTSFLFVDVAFEAPAVAEDDDVALEDAFDIAIITDSLELKSLFLHDQYHQIHIHVFPICLRYTLHIEALPSFLSCTVSLFIGN